MRLTFVYFHLEYLKRLPPGNGFIFFIYSQKSPSANHIQPTDHNKSKSALYGRAFIFFKHGFINLFHKFCFSWLV